MRTSTSGRSRPRTARFVVVATALLAAAGLAYALGTVASGSRRPIALHRTGERVRTSFGDLTVQTADLLSGLDASQLGGQSHNIRDLTTDDKALVEASVTITNTTGSVVAYSPSQFRLVGGAIVLAATEAMLPSGHLQPGTSVDGRLSFTVPRQGQRLRLEFRDLDGARIAVGLGNVDVAPPGAGQHAH